MTASSNWWHKAVAVLVAVGAIASGCSSGPNEDALENRVTSTTTGEVRPTGDGGVPQSLEAFEASLDLPDFADVAMTEKASVGFSAEVTGAEAIEISVSESATVPDGAGSEFEVLGMVSVSGIADFEGLAEVRFRPEQPLGSGVVPAVYWQTEDGQSVEPVPAWWDPSSGEIVAYVEHFSFGFFGYLPWFDLGIDLGLEFNPFGWMGRLSGRMGVEPSCSGEAPNFGAVDVDAGGDSVRWCSGADDGGAYVRLANNRTSFTAVEIPAGWLVEPFNGDGNSSSAFDAAAMTVGDVSASIDLGGGQNAASEFFIMSAGDTVDIRVPDGGQGWIKTDLSANSLAMSTITFAVDQLVMVATRYYQLHGDPREVASQVWLCAVTNWGGYEPSSGLEGLFGMVWAAVAGCLGDIGGAVIEALFGPALGLVGGKVLLGTLLIITGVTALSVFTRSIADELASITGESSTRRTVYAEYFDPDERRCAGLTAPLTTACELADAAANGDVVSLRAEAAKAEEFYESCCAVPVAPDERWDEAVTYNQTQTDAEMVEILAEVLATEPREGDNGTLFWDASVDCEWWQIEILGNGEWAGLFAGELEGPGRGCADPVPAGGFTEALSSIDCVVGPPAFATSVVGVNESLNVRSGPGLDSDVIQRLGVAAPVTAYFDVLYAGDGGVTWVMIELAGSDPGTACGWVSIEFLAG